jgi:hypothetical protein
MSLTDHARHELDAAGLFDEDSDYGGMLGTAVLELIQKFADQGHSGFSAALTIELFGKLARWEPLGPLTDSPGEWNRVTDELTNGHNLWQSARNPEAFSEDGGRTYYLLSERNRRRWGRPWRWIPVLRNRYPVHTAATT